MSDIQYQLTEKLAQNIIDTMSETVGDVLGDAMLADIQNDLLEALLKDFVVKPDAFDYDSVPTDVIRDGLRFLETDIVGHWLEGILPEAMTDAICETLVAVLMEREAKLAKEK